MSRDVGASVFDIVKRTTTDILYEVVAVGVERARTVIGFCAMIAVAGDDGVFEVERIVAVVVNSSAITRPIAVTIGAVVGDGAVIDIGHCCVAVSVIFGIDYATAMNLGMIATDGAV